MGGSKGHPVYSADGTVHVVTGEDKLDTLDLAIEKSEFLQHLEAAQEESGKEPGDFLVAVKPNIMTASVREDDSPVYTDPRLVERLIERMRERGFARAAVVESRNVYDDVFRVLIGVLDLPN